MQYRKTFFFAILIIACLLAGCGDESPEPETCQIHNVWGVFASDALVVRDVVAGIEAGGGKVEDVRRFRIEGDDRGIIGYRVRGGTLPATVLGCPTILYCDSFTADHTIPTTIDGTGYECMAVFGMLLDPTTTYVVLACANAI